MPGQNPKLPDLQQQNKPNYKSDIVICIDGTGSMAPCIEAVKAKIEKVITSTLREQAALHNADFNVRLRLIVFRDIRHDGAAAMQAFDFDEDVTGFVSKLQGVKAEGGDDEPESALDALAVALCSPWRDAKTVRRAIALFTDATALPTIEAETMKSIGHEDKTADGDVHFVISLMDHVRAKVYIAGPADASYEALAKVGADYRVTSADALADVDMDAWLTLIFKTLTQASATLPVGTRKVLNGE